MTETWLKILLVEDEPAHAEAIRRAFQASRERAELQVTETLGQFRDHVRASPPDIAIMDLNLPDGRAVEVLTSPEEMGRFPVLIMTSFGDEQVAVEAMKAGALDYIVKSPEAFATMPRIVERSLREWKLLRAQRKDKERIVHLNSVLRGIRNVNQLITRERDPQALIRKSCELLVESRGYFTSCILLCDTERILSYADAGNECNLLNLRHMIQDNELPECVRRALADTEICVRKNPATSCQVCPANSDYSIARGAAAVPLESAGRVYGALLVSLHDGLVDDVEEVDLLREAAGDVAFALGSIELQAERDRAERVAAQSREAWGKILESVQDGILVADTTTTMFTFANDAICGMLGYDRAEILTLGLDDIHPKESLPHVKEQFRRQMLGESSMAPEIPMLRKDGSVFVADVNAAPVQLENHNCVVGVFRDITERKKAAAQRVQLEEQLKLAQRLEAVGRLAGGVAHDFNNLLSVIISYAGFAAEELRESDPIHADVVEIQKAGQRAAALTRQLLAFSRKQVLEPEVLSLNKVVSGIESMLRRLLGEDIDIEVHLDEPLGSVMADPGQIEQVIMNLAVNARDAMPQGGKLTIETANVELDEDYAEQHVAVTPGRFVMLSVTDTGTGMDAETRAHIFDPFFTTKEKGKGTGLGLSTVYGIVKQSGGNIWVYSEPGRGTTFKVYLPRVDAPAVDVRRRPTTTMATGSETVLIVEDEDAVRRLAERILRSAGYQVHAAASGGDALVLCEKLDESIDLLLTDVVMPQMSGRELAERLGKSSPGLRVLYMSGYTDNAIVHHGVLDPGTRFLGKPFAATELTRKVRDVLDEDPK